MPQEGHLLFLDHLRWWFTGKERREHSDPLAHLSVHRAPADPPQRREVSPRMADDLADSIAQLKGYASHEEMLREFRKRQGY